MVPVSPVVSHSKRVPERGGKDTFTHPHASLSPFPPATAPNHGYQWCHTPLSNPREARGPADVAPPAPCGTRAYIIHVALIR